MMNKEEAHFKAMALADGELESRELPALVDQLARDASLLKAAQSYLDLRRRRLGRVYAKMRDEPVPQYLQDLLAEAPMGRDLLADAPTGRRAARHPIVSSLGRAWDRIREELRVPGVSMAAGAALAVAAVAVAWVLTPPPGVAPVQPGAQVQAAIEPAMTPQVRAALEQAATSQDISIPGMKMTLLRTYWSSDQFWCRQFDLASDTRQIWAVACRDDGNWRMVLQTPPGPANTGFSAPASTTRVHLDNYVTSHLRLEPANTASVIGSGWSAPARAK